MEKFAAVILPPHNLDIFQRTVFVEGHRGMIHQIGVPDIEHAAMVEEDAYVAFQLVADHEGAVKPGHESLLLGSETERIRGIDCGEIGVAHRIGLSFHCHLLEIGRYGG